ncbi:chemotaxis-specific protein-glutamate methyltransferase CheB [Desulfovibrio inopinatus]|uniref:chemotaxis-specific protein-glutamate methyltransferase CheB n=1 Tax=Desulfovibrio inopinatus TaxID=102109 RepID=UPI000414741C|nr:chemotaxis-specific protein-glutamate methyltransferase CheB [Desulfovibrio inopinatus]
MIRVLIVDDSHSVCVFMRHVLESDGTMEVVGIAEDGRQAVEMTNRLKPDVITMDITMPVLNGIEATREIMATRPTPIVIVSSDWSPSETAKTFQAMDAGALTLLRKPGLGRGNDEACYELIKTVKLMSEIKVVRRVRRRLSQDESTPSVSAHPKISRRIECVAIGASTGGPQALSKILSVLPKSFPVPILLVQHMSPGFINGMVQWLGSITTLPVVAAKDSLRLEPGVIYVAPDGVHMGVTPGPRIHLSTTPVQNGLRPSVSYMFASVGRVFSKKAAAVLLTGMGRDGAVEMKKLRDLGALTIAQDKASSTVHGMPGTAIALGGAERILPLDAIGPELVTSVG